MSERDVFKPITDADVLRVCNRTGWQTYRQIAQALNRKKTPSLIERVKRLAGDGSLEYGFRKMPNGVEAHVFRIPRVNWKVDNDE